MDKLINYVVINAADNALKEARCYSKYDVTIQSGCALTEDRLATLSDDVGENISELNPVYSELTALYWVWKNKKSDYVGWSHYRRILDVEEKELEHMLMQGIDVIMPIPVLFSDSVKEQYLQNTALDTWDIMMAVLKRREPEYYALSLNVFEQNLFFPYCMGIYKYDYFVRYCEWLFPILDEVYAVIGEKWDVYQNRYIAFLAERLHSLYFIANADKLNYKVVPCILLPSIESATDVGSESSEEEILQRVQDLLHNRQARKAYLYMKNIIKMDSRFHSEKIVLIYKVLAVIFYENLYTENIMCRFTENVDELIEHFCALVDCLKFMQQSSRMKQRNRELEVSIWEYLVETNTSCFAVKFIIEKELENDSSVLRAMADLYLENGDAAAADIILP